MAFTKTTPQIEDRLQESIWKAGISKKKGNLLYELFLPYLNEFKKTQNKGGIVGLSNSHPSGCYSKNNHEPY